MTSRPRAIASIRSHSLTRNSLIPRIIVLPEAKAATTDRIGYSSIIEGARFGGTSTPLRLEAFTRKSATGSPPSKRLFSNSILAPISTKVVNKPERVGFKPILGKNTSEPSTIKAAHTGKAAEDGSHGTAISCAINSGRPCNVISKPSLVSTVSISAPKPLNILSE